MRVRARRQSPQMHILGIVLCFATFVVSVTYIAAEQVISAGPMPRSVEKAFIAVCPPIAVAGVVLFCFA